MSSPFFAPALPVLAVAAVSALSGCWLDDTPQQLLVTGETMGTTYSVLVIDPPEDTTEEALLDRIETVLAEVNGKLSNWDPNSEVSLFNAMETTDPVPVSGDFAAVIARADEIYALSEGRFDLTVAPLVELWGFGPRKPEDPVPADAAIAEAMTAIGQADMLTLADGSLAKTRPDVTVNLSAIAKGYGVDRVAQALRDDGMEHYIVEIGGDLAAQGLNLDGEPWIIGIETPDAVERSVNAVVQFSEGGLATSGDYRNYFERDGVRYSHIIDPTTGRPITHSTASVTAIAEDAMSADALATAFLALGAEAGLPIANAEGLALLFIDHDGSGFVTRASDAFPELLSDTR